LDFACFPYQVGDRFLLPSIVKRPSATGSELPKIVDAACAAIFQQTIVQTNTPSSRGYFYHVIRGGSFQRWWRAGRGRGTEREPLGDTFSGNAAQVSTPRVHRCTFFSIGRAIWFLAFVANISASIPEP
jgi:hypothetical protein